MKAKTHEITTPDEYLAALSDDKRRSLEKLRKDIKAAAPKAEECISYGIPGFRLNGELLVSYGAAAKHCAFYPGSTLQAFEKKMKGRAGSNDYFGERELACVFTSWRCFSTTRRNSRSMVLKASWITLASGA